jgi:hypothetical protein
MVLDYFLSSIEPKSFLELTRTSFEQSLTELYTILPEEHLQVSLETLEEEHSVMPTEVLLM